MLGAEGLILSLLVEKPKTALISFWLFLMIHAIFMGLLGWVIYRILVKKKKKICEVG